MANDTSDQEMMDATAGADADGDGFVREKQRLRLVRLPARAREDVVANVQAVAGLDRHCGIIRLRA
jgi:hypothetical protein